jgi:hypothetical protein
MNALYCELSREEFNQISACKSAYEIWNTLQITYKGTSKVKETRISILTEEYECFRMTKGEIIKNMYTRFGEIVNPLKNLGVNFWKNSL